MKPRASGCGDCVYYNAHYTKVDGKFIEVFCGHCYHPRMKRRDPDAKTCKNFSGMEFTSKAEREN